MTENERQKTNGTERSSEEKTAIAGGVALLVIAVLFFGWAILFFKKIERGGTRVELGGAVEDQFNLNTVRRAQEELERSYESTIGEFRAIREELGEGRGMQVQEIQVQGGEEESVFGTPEE